MSYEELLAWLRLTQTAGVGPVTGRRLLAAFGGAEAVFAAPATAWRAVVGEAAAASLRRVAPDLEARARATLAWLQADAAGSVAAAGPTAQASAGGKVPPSRRLVTLADEEYPSRLLQTADPPLVLYAAGNLALLDAPSLAIVGSRHATAEGREHAYAFANHLSARGLAIVSGLALGIDGAAHEGALQSGGATVAVLGSGIDRIYPRQHLDLARRIAAQGLLLSEHALGTPPLSPHFPRRNRIIAGLTLGTLVVEAALQSGSLITARLALEAGREVFAIPGSIHAPQARGCHRLIQQGAKLVETGDDILQELRFQDCRPMSFGSLFPASLPAGSPHSGATIFPSRTSTMAAASLAAPSQDTVDPLLEAMGHQPATLDALSARTGLGAAALGAQLLELELAGRISRLPGGLVQRRAVA